MQLNKKDKNMTMVGFSLIGLVVQVLPKISVGRMSEEEMDALRSDLFLAELFAE